MTFKVIKYNIILKDLLIIAVITYSLLNVNNLLLMVKQIHTPDDIRIIIKDIYVNGLHSKSTWRIQVKIFLDMLEKFKSFF